MANRYTPRGIQFVRFEGNAGHEQMANQRYALAAGRSGNITPNTLLTLTGSTDSDGVPTVDATTAEDTANSSGKKIVGLAKNLFNAAGDPLVVPYLPASKAGYVEVTPARGAVFACLEDGDGGVMTLSGSCQLAPNNTAVNSDPEDAEQFVPQPYRNDLLESSTRNATATHHALQILGRYASVRNIDTTGRAVVEFKINSTWLPD